jgi:outer membrane protein assembly factor BamB
LTVDRQARAFCTSTASASWANESRYLAAGEDFRFILTSNDPGDYGRVDAATWEQMWTYLVRGTSMVFARDWSRYHLTALDTATGSELWSQPATRAENASEPQVVDGGLVVPCHRPAAAAALS